MVDDCVNEACRIALQREVKRNPEYEFFEVKYLDMLKAAHNAIKLNFGDFKYLERHEIPDFYDKVMCLVKEHGYSESEAHEYVFKSESIKKYQIYKRSYSSNQRDYDINEADCDKLDDCFSPIDSADALSVIRDIQKIVYICLVKVVINKKKGGTQRDIDILSDHFLNEDLTGKEIAEKYGVTPARVSQIIKENVVPLLECISEQLAVDPKDAIRI